MKTEEKSELYHINRRKGYDEIKANGEANEFIETQKKFKILNRESKKKDTVIRNLNKKLEEKNKKLNELRKKLGQKEQLKGKEMFLRDANINNNTPIKGSLHSMRRIIHLMEKDKQYTMTDLSKEFMLPIKEVKICLMLLQDLNWLKRLNEGYGIKYERI